MYKIIGKCGKCGDNVVQIISDNGVTTKCGSCGATPKQTNLPVIEMNEQDPRKLLTEA